MKPTQLTELLANIRKTFVSFFSILMFVALGVGVFLGINWTSPALEGAAEGVFDEGAFHHVQVTFPYGLTESDIDELSSVEGVTSAEGARQAFADLSFDMRSHHVKLQTAGVDIDKLRVMEGELPQRDDELALKASSAKEWEVRVGDVLDVAPDDATPDDDASDGPNDPSGASQLKARSFKVTALVESPEYLALSTSTYGFTANGTGSVDTLAWVPASAFDDEAFHDGYPVVNVRCDGLDSLGTFTDEYKQSSVEIEQRVTELGGELAKARYDDLHNQAQKKVDEGETQLSEAESHVAQGERDIADGKQQLEEGRTSLEQKRAEGEARLASAYQQLMQYESEKAEAEKLIAAARTLYEEGSKAAKHMKDNEKVVIDGQTYTVKELRELLPLAKEELDKYEKELEEKSAQLAEGWSKYYAGQQELESETAAAEQRLADGEAQITQAEQQVADGKRQIEEKKPELEQDKEQVASMREYDWTVAGRSYNAGAVQVSTFSGMTGRLSLSMAALFVIVGLLVSYSAVSRIVHEQVMQIGTKKALGLRSGEITLSFLAYSAIAVVLGSVVGMVVGVTLVEGIIGHALGGMFIFGDYPPFFGVPLALGMTVLELALVLGATWLACRQVLREHAVELLKGEKPPEAKTRFFEKWALWDRLPLFTQTIVNNCLNDKRRVFSTVVGVAGCTALIVTAITLNDDVMASYDAQYDEVYGFNAIGYLDASVEGAAENVEGALRGEGLAGTPVRRQTVSAELPDGSRGMLKLVVPADSESFGRFYHVHPIGEGSFDPAGDGVWVSRAYADHLDARPGDELAFSTGDGVTRRVKITGFYDFFLTEYETVMGQAAFEEAFGGDVEPNALLVDSVGTSVDDVSAALSGTDGFDMIVDDQAKQANAFRQFSGISRTVVLIYLALATLMAVVVLLNLNVMFIEEKKRELIVLMINGFSVRDAKRYIYNDTVVLTVIGIAAGLALGALAGSATVASVEPSTATFLKGVAWRAVAVGTVGTAVLAFAMSAVALRRIPRFSLIDINKL